ncbi:MAG: Mov34/MPN/PAD-1 family protein [Acidiferrobacterales bacterium]
MLMLCPPALIDLTLGHLRDAGQDKRECIVLWLGRREGELLRVHEAYRPIQNASEDMFEIPPAGMTALYAELRKRRLMVAAQVHSHPGDAFHSRADDRWAIIRHEGALSLVVPYFASATTVSNFLDQANTYHFTAAAHWVEVPRAQVERGWLQIT